MKELVLKFAEIPAWAHAGDGYPVYLLARLREAGVPVAPYSWKATTDEQGMPNFIERGTLLETKGLDCIKYVWVEDAENCAQA